MLSGFSLSVMLSGFSMMLSGFSLSVMLSGFSVSVMLSGFRVSVMLSGFSLSVMLWRRAVMFLPLPLTHAVCQDVLGVPAAFWEREVTSPSI
jgi:hypothetical protein